MKTHGLILLSALLVAALMLHGQEAAPPSVDLFPEQEEEPSPTPPPNGPELPELKQLDDSFKPKSLGTDADALQVHALWRQLKNRTVNDPDVQAAKKYAQAARTDLEKRKRLSDLLRGLLSANVCFGHDAGAQSGLASTERYSSGHLSSTARATIADARVFWDAVADANKHAFQEKGQRETQKAESAQVASGCPEVGGAIWAANLHTCNAGTRVCQGANIGKCCAMLDLAKILLAAPTAVF